MLQEGTDFDQVGGLAILCTSSHQLSSFGLRQQSGKQWQTDIKGRLRSAGGNLCLTLGASTGGRGR